MFIIFKDGFISPFSIKQRYVADIPNFLAA
jgi:hypothetical protein